MELLLREFFWCNCPKIALQLVPAQLNFEDHSVQRNLSLKLDGLHGTASNVQDKKKTFKREV
jgi:hypothetical protein